MFFLNKYISKLLIVSLIIISFYNICSIFLISFSPKIEGYFVKTLNYLPYKYTIFFQKPIKYSKKAIQSNKPFSKKFFNLIKSTENNSALDYMYWETKILHEMNNKSTRADFEGNFINLAILSKNNIKKKRSIKLYYLRNIPRFGKDVGNIILSNN